MKTNQIISVEDAEDPHPWYELEIRSDAPYIVSDKDGGTDFDMSDTAHSVPPWVDLPEPAQQSMSSDVAYGVTQGGEFIAFPPDTPLVNQDVELRALLAWYDSATDEFTVLDFVE